MRTVTKRVYFKYKNIRWVAHLAERRAYTTEVAGSIPAPPII